MNRVGLGLLIGAVGCAPIQSTTSSLETVVSTETVVTEPESRFLTAKVDVSPANATLRVTQSGSCEEKQVETVRVQKKTTRTAKRSVLLFELAAAGLGIGLGAAVAIDSSSVPEQDDPLQSNPVSPEQAQAIGLVVLGLGVVAGRAAGLDLLRAKDKVADEGTIKRDVDGASKIITCSESVVADEDVGLIVRGRYVPAGRLDASGNLSVGWDVIPDELIGMTDWPGQATVAVGPANEIQGIVEGGGKLTSEAVGLVLL